MLIATLVAVSLAFYRDSEKTRDLVEFVRLRDALFTTTVDSAAWHRTYLHAGSPENSTSGFRTDSPDRSARFLRSSGIDATVAVETSTSGTIDAIIAILKKLPGPGKNGCGTVRSLSDKIRSLALSSGYGCCSDFTKVFQVIASANGLAAREVLNSIHNFIEVWEPRETRWIFVDPQFGLLATDPDGTYLGAMQIARSARSHKVIKWIFISKGVAFADQWRAAHSLYASPIAWSEIRMPMGSDVVAQDAFDRRIRPLPRLPAQLIAYLTGARPTFARITLQSSVP